MFRSVGGKIQLIRGRGEAMKMRRQIAVLAAVALVAPLGSAAFAHKADLIGRGRVAELRYGRSTFDDAVDLFGSPSSRRRIDGCVPTLIAKWPGIKLFFDRSEGRRVINGFVRARSVPTADGESLMIHTRKGLRVEDTVKKLKRRYPNARSFRASRGRRDYLLEGRDGGGAFLRATARRGRVLRLISGFTC
jgi:hypothetical protein